MAPADPRYLLANGEIDQALTALKSGNLEQVRLHLEKAHSFGLSLRDLQYLSALYFLSVNEVERAVSALREEVSHFPENLPAQELLTHLRSQLTPHVEQEAPRLQLAFGRTTLLPERKKLLWIRPDSIGDAVLSLGMLPAVQRAYSQHEIVVVCQERIAEIYLACPVVTAVLAFNYHRLGRDEPYRVAVVEAMRQLRADIAVHSVFSRDPVGDFLTLASDARERIGHRGNDENISAAVRAKNDELYTKVIDTAASADSELEKNSAFLSAIGAQHDPLVPTLWTGPEDEEFAERFFREHSLDPQRTIALFAAAQYEIRKVDQCGAALRQICSREGFSVIALGTAKDIELNQQSLDKCGARSVNLCGKTTLLQSAALLRRCRLAVGADTGPAHIACAVGCPNVIVLGGGHFGRFMPYSALTSIVALPLDCFGCRWQCKFGYPHCIRDVHSHVIEEAVQQTILQSSSRARLFLQSSVPWGTGSGAPSWRLPDAFLDPQRVDTILVDVGTRTAKPRALAQCADSRELAPLALRQAAPKPL